MKQNMRGWPVLSGSAPARTSKIAKSLINVFKFPTFSTYYWNQWRAWQQCVQVQGVQCTRAQRRGGPNLPDVVFCQVKLTIVYMNKIPEIFDFCLYDKR